MKTKLQQIAELNETLKKDYPWEGEKQLGRAEERISVSSMLDAILSSPDPTREEFQTLVENAIQPYVRSYNQGRAAVEEIIQLFPDTGELVEAAEECCHVLNEYRNSQGYVMDIIFLGTAKVVDALNGRAFDVIAKVRLALSHCTAKGGKE